MKKTKDQYCEVQVKLLGSSINNSSRDVYYGSDPRILINELIDQMKPMLPEDAKSFKLELDLDINQISFQSRLRNKAIELAAEAEKTHYFANQYKEAAEAWFREQGISPEQPHWSLRLGDKCQITAMMDREVEKGDYYG